jgi:type II secretory pathway predicted ATPase ExeA
MIAPRRYPSSRPFLAAPRTDFYHPARVIDSAVHGLDRLVRRSEGIGLVVGPPGTGKSLLLAKLAESVRDDFDVALLSGARICTRRALWQSILAEIGEPYRGIDEAELRIGLVERVRGLAATGSGLVVLVDEAHTLPTRLLEELRLLTNLPTPLPAVHILLVGTAELEEILAAPRMESLSQRIGGRFYLEPLDHAETTAYVRTQMKAAGLDWDAAFEPGCDDAVFSASDGVPRIVNQICDLALVLVEQNGRVRVTPADIAAAWAEIQRLPTPAAMLHGCSPSRHEASAGPEAAPTIAPGAGGIEVEGEMGIIEFGGFEMATMEEQPTTASEGGGGKPFEGTAVDPWHGPEVEMVFDPYADPFEEFFEQEERVVERFVMRGPDDFSGCRHVASREGLAMARQLDAVEHSPPVSASRREGTAEPDFQQPAEPRIAQRGPAVMAVVEAEESTPEATDGSDDADMVMIEEDLVEHPTEARRKSFFAVRPGDYRSLFARLRRGDR